MLPDSVILSLEPSNNEVEPLLEALLRAFPSSGALHELARKSFGESASVDLPSGPETPRKLAYAILFDVAIAKGQVKALLLGALRLRPDNEELFNAIAPKLRIEDFLTLCKLLKRYLQQHVAGNSLLRQAESAMESRYQLPPYARIGQAQHRLPLLLHLADLLPVAEADLPPLLEFVERVARREDPPSLRTDLQAWSAARAQRFQVPLDRVHTWRIAMAPPPRYCLVVRVTPCAPDLAIHAFLIEEGNSQSRLLFQETLAADKDLPKYFSARFAKELEQGPLADALGTTPEMHIEFIAPRALLCLPWDQIQIPLDEDFHERLGRAHLVYARPLERFAQKAAQMRALLDIKRQALNQGGSRVKVLASTSLPTSEDIALLLSGNDLVAVALTAPPPESFNAPDHRKTDVLAGCIAHGIPVVLWVRRAVEDPAGLEQHVRELLADLLLAPQAVKTARSKSASTPPSVSDTVRDHLALLWDATSRQMPELPASPLEPPSIGG